MRPSLLALPLLLCAAVAPAQIWAPVPTLASPLVDARAAMVYDSPRQGALLFGGSTDYGAGPVALSGETWFWNGISWAREAPLQSPSARHSHAMVFDENRQEVLLFGGRAADGSSLGDTWAWNGFNWKQLALTVNPPARYAHSMTYDPVRREVILFGGVVGNVDAADTWAWNGSAWRSVNSPNSPPARSGHSIVFLRDTQSVVLYGGQGKTDTWLWSGSNWQAVSTAVNPGSLTEFAFVHDIRSGHAILFGGRSAAPTGHMQTWAFGAAGWKQLITPVTPPAGYGLMAAYDFARGISVIFGGVPERYGGRETWTFSSGALCAFTAPATRIDIPADGGSGEITVPSMPSCAWSATTSAPWLTLNSASGTGPTVVRYTAAANPGQDERTAKIVVSGREYLAVQAGQPCPAGAPLPASTVMLKSGCNAVYTYIAAAGDRLAFRGMGTGYSVPGSIDQLRSSYTAVRITGPAPSAAVVAEAPSPGPNFALTYLPASGFVSLPAAGTYTVTVSTTGGPDGVSLFTALFSRAPCAPDLRFYSQYGSTLAAYDLDPTYASGGSHRASVGVQPGCSGVVTAGAPWVTSSVASVPEGFSLFDVRVEPNAGAGRATTLTVGNSVNTIRQPSNDCGFYISVSSAIAPPGLSTGTIDIAAPFCQWTVSSSAPWLQPYPLTGLNTGEIRYTVFPNFSTRPRTATLSIASHIFTLTQQPATGTAMQRFVQLLYFSFMGRMPAQSEVDFHVASGLSREQLALNFFNSEEFNNAGRFVAGLYVGLLDRDAEHGGWLFQRNALSTNQVDQDSLVSNFLDSLEYRTRFGTPADPEFVRMLYRKVLLREPLQAEVDFQVDAVRRYGAPGRRIVARAFLNAPEFRAGTGARLTAFLSYAALLQRQATSAEFTAASALVNQAQALPDPAARLAMIRDSLLGPIIRSAEMTASLE